MVQTVQDILPPEVGSDETVYVIDDKLEVVFTNAGWANFAAHNNGARVLAADWNRRVLDNFSGTEREKWRHIYQLLLDGRLPMYREPVNASGPFDRRTYDLRITPRRDDTGAVRWLVHHTRPVDDEAVMPAMPTDAALGQYTNAQAIREYQQRVMQRPVQLRGFRTARYFQPLDEVGGDVLWSCERPDGVALLMHGDAMGHGIAAARLAAQLTLLLDEIAARTADPTEIGAHVNAALLDRRADEAVTFATGLLFVVMPGSSEMHAVNFGHHGPIFSRSGPLHVESGMPLGVSRDGGPWPRTRIDLRAHGDRFLVFSDGILEQFDAQGRTFGVEGLMRAFRAHLHEPLEAMLNHIVESVSAHRGEALIKDDQTLLALELTQG